MVAKKTAKKTVKTNKVGKTDKRRTIVNATTPTTFRITPYHVEIAECGDPDKCVIAQALRDMLGGLVEAFEVGTRVTRIATETKIFRYTTPCQLATALRNFDNTGDWKLPPGEYTLLPFVKRPARWNLARRQGGKQDVFRGRALPTRRTMKITTMCSI